MDLFNRERPTLFVVALLVTLFLMACGPSAPTTEDTNDPVPAADSEANESATTGGAIALGDGAAVTSEEAPVSAVSTEALPETVSEDAAVPEVINDVGDTPAAVDGSEMIRADGLPVGFTADGRPYIGNLDAPVVIEEFSDFQCPYCSRFFTDTLPSILSGAIADGEAVLVFYDFPLDFHPQADEAAEAARCAGDESPIAYWEMHDALFENISEWSNNQPEVTFIRYAEDIGLEDIDRFSDCMETDKYVELIQNDLNIGFSRGVTGTPTFFMNEQILVGAQPLARFNQAIALVAGGESIEPEPAAAAELDIPPFEMPEQVVLAEDYAAVVGDPNAPILIVEFTDYQCPFCSRHSSQTFPQILDQMIDSGRVRYALKDFPLDSIHPQARIAAAAARCAGEQEAYWEMHDLLFDQQAVWGQSADPAAELGFLAGRLNLDGDAFGECLASGRYDESIQAHFDEGVQYGVNGTPAFFIGGYFVSGAQPYEIFDVVVSNLEEGTIEQLFREAYDQQVEAYKAQQAQQAQQVPPTPAAPVDVAIGDAFSIGDPDAPIVIVEYTDFQCPYCGRHFAQTFPQIKRDYVDQGLVRYVFKDFPLGFHAEADEAAQAARCANEQDGFLAMHDLLFSRQGQWSGQSNVLDIFTGYAVELGLEESAFRACVDSGRYADAVQADFQEGSSLGVTGTPSFFINGRPLVGAVPYTTFAQAIDTLLNEQ